MIRNRNIATNLVCVITALLIVSLSGRSVEATPLANQPIEFADLCVLFDCSGGASTSEPYSISPEPDPDGTLSSIALPGLAPEVLGAFLYAYQLIQDDESTAVVDSLVVPFDGLLAGISRFL